MSGVKRYDCTNGGASFCRGCYTMTECALGDYVSSEDYDTAEQARANAQEEAELLAGKLRFSNEQRDTLRTANQRLECELARLREALTEIRKTSIVHRYAKLQALAMREVAVSALSTANGEVAE